MSIIRETVELQAALYEIAAGRNGDANDLARLRYALDLALDRWPEIDPEPAVWFVAQAHINEVSPWRQWPRVLLHLENCPHFYTEAERRENNTRDPEIRQTTAEERARTLDEFGRTWRHCKDCDRKAEAHESWPANVFGRTS